VLVQTYNLVQESGTPQLLVTANLALITTAALAALWNLAQLRAASWLDPEPAIARPADLTRLEQQVLRSLQAQIDERHAYREEGLTIGALAERMKTREQVLRRVINRGLGFRNFNDFLHALRIREACDRLRRAEDARLPVLSIALGVGYGSIGPFNRAFKARMGMTPTRFRQAGNGTRPPA
jgi:AraC-like DNA-binding protein